MTAMMAREETPLARHWTRPAVMQGPVLPVGSAARQRRLSARTALYANQPATSTTTWVVTGLYRVTRPPVPTFTTTRLGRVSPVL